MAELHYKDGSVWVKPTHVYYKDDTTWRELKAIWYNDNGVWRQIYQLQGQIRIGGNYSGSNLIFGSDGSVSSANLLGDNSWYMPPTANIGSGIWIRLTKTGGSRNVTNNGVFLPLSSNQTFNATGGPGNCLGTVTFAADAAGLAVIASGTFAVSNAL